MSSIRSPGDPQDTFHNIPQVQAGEIEPLDLGRLKRPRPGYERGGGSACDLEEPESIVGREDSALGLGPRKRM
jgi:hypothetical protein